MPDTARMRSTRLGGREGYRIGIVSDTHDAQDPVGLIRKLGRQDCDYYVHLGDIGGSRLVAKLVREYKQSLGSLDNLSPEDRRHFHDLRKQGLTPVWAYIETKLGSDLQARSQRLKETRQSWDVVLAEMSKLPDPLFVSGNIDSSLIKTNVVAPEFHRHGLFLIVQPHFLELDSGLAILWPSMKGTEAELVKQLDQTVEQLVELSQNRSRVVILAHEPLFKGPRPHRYMANVEASGLTASTVPYFEPNPSWKLLLRLLRAVPAEVELAFVYGHVHDPHHVIQAGAPYLRGSLAEGLEYRLFGLGSPAAQYRAKGRRALRMFCVPSSRVAVLTVGQDSLQFEIVAVG